MRSFGDRPELSRYVYESISAVRVLGLVYEEFSVYYASKHAAHMYREVGRGQAVGLVGRQVILGVCRCVKCLLFGEALSVRGFILNKFERK